MPIINRENVLVGDILEETITIMHVPLFKAGTVLDRQRLVVLSKLGVDTITIENRTDSKYMTVPRAIKRIEERFSYVEGIPLMMTIKSWIQDIVRHRGGK